VGPGLGKFRAAEILELIEKAKQPMVVDADGLNILAEKISTLKHCKGKRLLTPHPGEMKRLSRGEKETRAKTATKPSVRAVGRVAQIRRVGCGRPTGPGLAFVVALLGGRCSVVTPYRENVL